MPAAAPDSRAPHPAPARAPVGPVVQAITILRHLGVLGTGAGVNAIARATGIGPSSCFNVLRTLAGEGMVSFDPVTKLYRIGHGTVDLARMALQGDGVVSLAQPAMQRLAARVDATVGLWRLTEADRLVLVALADSGAATRIHMAIGQRQPVGAGATGRAVLAARGLAEGGLDDRAIRAAYAGILWRVAPGEAAFLAQVRAAEAQGWAADLGHINHGISTVATVLSDGAGEPRFVLSLSVFSGAATPAGLAALGATLRDEAAALRALAYGGDTMRTKGDDRDAGAEP